MRFKHGDQVPCCTWGVVWIGAICFLSGNVSSIAQENAPVGAVHSVDGAGRSSLNEFPAQEASSEQLVYTVRILELPTDKAMAHAKNWPVLGATSQATDASDDRLQANAAVVQASFTKSAEEFSVRFSSGMSDQQIVALLAEGQIVSAPKIIGYGGQQVNVRIGEELPFVTSFETVKDASGHDTDRLQPVITKLRQGIALDLVGTLDESKRNVSLRLKYEESEVKGVDTFTFEAAEGPLTVQQPSLSVHAIQTTHMVPLNTTLALCTGSTVVEKVVKRELPILGKLPYLGRLFQNTAKAKEPVSKIILIQCRMSSENDGF